MKRCFTLLAAGCLLCSTTAAQPAARPVADRAQGTNAGRADIPPAEQGDPRMNAEVVREKELWSRLLSATNQAETLQALETGWDQPPVTCRPHTRWWWPGNAVTREGIDFQLQEMKDKGFGGVEIMTFASVFEKGNIEYESPEYVAMVKYAVDRCRALGMEVSLNLGPGWTHGNANVPEPFRSQALVYSAVETAGGKDVSLELSPPSDPPYAKRGARTFEAAVAVPLEGERPDLARRLDLTHSVTAEPGFTREGKTLLRASLPEGRWRILAFWTVFTGQKCAAEGTKPRTWVVDHLNPAAVRDYAERSLGRFRASFGADFGQTVDSVFGDSFEISQDWSLWSAGLFERFRAMKGYDLKPFLPRLLSDGDPLTPYVRYDFGHFLHCVGMEATIGVMADTCAAVGLRMRQQPHYRFTVELIEASGRLQTPETEMSRRSFDPLAFIHKLTTSGAIFYPPVEPAPSPRWVSAEAFTFLNMKYRTSPAEIKMASDLFLRDGVTQFYNHGYFYTPEREIAPSRDLVYMNRISHVAPWWPWYRDLADYQARGCFLSRAGRTRAKVLVYSPMPSVWAKSAEWPLKHVREVPFGRLPKMLVAAGYDFECVNDDLLVRHARMADGMVHLNGFACPVVVLPDVTCLDPATALALERFAAAGGTLFALKTLPRISPGLEDHERRDAELAAVIARLFATQGGTKDVGKGRTHFLPDVASFDNPVRWTGGAHDWEPTPPLDGADAVLVRQLKNRVRPDVELPGIEQSQGLTHRVTRLGDVDLFFLCNLQPHAYRGDILLDTPHRHLQVWDPLTGTRHAFQATQVEADGRLRVPLSFEGLESVFLVATASDTPGLPVTNIIGRNLEGCASREPDRELPGPWQVSLRGLGNLHFDRTMETLVDWSRDEELSKFSGVGSYRTEFDLATRPDSIMLDLGQVAVTAAVTVNGTVAGKCFMAPYRLDIGPFCRQGRNHVEIEVANQLWNYCAGLDRPTPMPADLVEHYGNDISPHIWEHFRKMKKNRAYEPMPSGLLGPVRLRFVSPP